MKAQANNGMQRTRNQQVSHHQSSVRAADAGRWAEQLSGIGTLTQRGALDGSHNAQTLSVRITVVVLLVVLINLVWSFYQIHLDSIEAREAAKHGVIICNIGAYGEVFSRIEIGMSMLVVFTGLCFKGFKSTAISLVGLGGATVIYVFWWQFYFKLAEIASPSELEHINHIAYLHQANYLDILIAASIGLLISLHIRSAVLPLLGPTKPCS